MKIFWLLVMIFLSLTTISTADLKYAMPGCNYMCGKVKIPYPFGMGANCSVNQWYNVDCNSSTPYLSALNGLEVLRINLENQTVTVNVSMISDCRNPVRNSSQILNVDLDGSPFLFSRLHNKFVVKGCGNAFIMDHGRVLVGCSTTCRNDSVSEVSNCLGINCCQTTIPYSLKSYSMNLRGLERQVEGGDAVCGSAFLVDENSHVRPDLSGNISNYVPISLLWTLTDRDLSMIHCCYYYDEQRLEVDLGNGKSVKSYKCTSRYLDLEGNLYIKDGCENVDDVVSSFTQECQRCRSHGGDCYYDEMYSEDGLVRTEKQSMTCNYYPRDVPDRYEGKKSVGVILGIFWRLIWEFHILTRYQSQCALL